MQMLDFEVQTVHSQGARMKKKHTPKRKICLENIGKYHNFRQLDCWFQGFQVDGNERRNGGPFPGAIFWTAVVLLVYHGQTR